MEYQPIDQHGWELIVVFGSFTVGYTIHYVIFHSNKIAEWFRQRLPGPSAEVWRNLLYRTVMVVFFFAVPAVLLSVISGMGLRDYGVAFHFSWPRLAVIGGLSIFLVGLIAVNPGRSRLTGYYPHMRIGVWSPGHIVINVLSWAAYLFAYELMFRGYMLTVLMPAGVVTAVAVNIAIYVAVHVPKGVSEAIGAVPFGLVVCYLTLAYGTIWAAFFLHLALALANSFVALRGNPEMRISWITSRADRSASQTTTE
jgi:membrane protease YdiL (CAAX protease family)